jgi:hypothetical protein
MKKMKNARFSSCDSSDSQSKKAHKIKVKQHLDKQKREIRKQLEAE